MSLLHAGLYALGAFYGTVGVTILHRARKPSCRICVHRACCPVREAALHDPAVERCFEKSATAEQAI